MFVALLLVRQEFRWSRTGGQAAISNTAARAVLLTYNAAVYTQLYGGLHIKRGGVVEYDIRLFSERTNIRVKFEYSNFFLYPYFKCITAGCHYSVHLNE